MDSFFMDYFPSLLLKKFLNGEDEEFELVANVVIEDEQQRRRKRRRGRGGSVNHIASSPSSPKMAAAAAKGVSLNHIARESTDVKRLAKFYQEILGFEMIESPKFGEFEVIWLRLPNSFAMHLIERYPNTKLPEGPWSATSAVQDPKNLPRGHHLSFSVSNFDSFVQTLKENEFETFEKTQLDGKTKQVFFFDPDGNGLEVGSWE